MERQLQLKTQQQFTKEYMEAKGLKEEQEAGQSQGPGPGPGSTTSALGPLPTTPGALAHTSSDTDEEANKDGEQDEQPRNEGEEVSSLYTFLEGLYYGVFHSFQAFLCIVIVFRKRKMMTTRVRRKRRMEKRKITPSSLRWAQSSTGMGPSHHSSLPYPPRHRPSQSHHLRLFRLPSSPSNPYQTTTPRTIQEAPAQSYKGCWWDSRCWANSNRVNSWLG